MRRFLAVPIILVALIPAWAASSAAQTEQPGRVLVIGLPEDQARALAQRRPMAAGLGVYPDSRDARAFLARVARGDDGASGVAGAASDAGIGIGVGATASVQGEPAADVAAAFGTPGTVADALGAPIAIVALRLADDAEALLRLDDRPAIVVGTIGRTPVLVGLLDVASDGVLGGGVARRTGVVTPGDLAATILDRAGLPTGATAGEVLIIKPSARPLDLLDALAARWEADLGFTEGLTLATVGVGIFAVVFGSLALAMGYRRIASVIAVGGAAAPAGYVGGLFLEGADWTTRAGVVIAAFLLGAIGSFAGPRRAAGWLMLATTFGVAALTIVASSAPDGSVAAALWGDPLGSWRFFGLRNHLAMFLAGGFVAGVTLLAMPSLLLVAGGVVVGSVVGAATLGANFVAVAVLGFAVVLVVLARASGRPRFIHLPFAGVAGVLAALAALLADAGTPASHGGRAVQGVRDGGLEAAWDILTRRARLNYEEITSLGWVGPIAFVLAAFALALLFWWALREANAEPYARAGVGGLAAAALITLIAEDSGFFVGSILGLYPWVVFALDQAVRVDGDLTTPGTAPPPEAAAT